jgi:hypothetical protein
MTTNEINTAPELSTTLTLPPSATYPQGDSLSLASLRLPQDFTVDLGVKKKLLTIPVRKPDRTWFIRTHPDEAYRARVLTIELKEERETYIVHPSLSHEGAVLANGSPRLLVAAVNRQGVAFLIPARLPGPDGKFDPWGESLLTGLELARTRWVRISSNTSLGAYEIFEAMGLLPDPVWPEESLGDWVNVGFRNRIITTSDHPVLRKLRGEV